MPAPSRLKWKCRRGMREMDILLGRFLERGYDALDPEQRAAFEALLELPDQDILAWLSGSALPEDESLRGIVAAVRDVVQGP